MPNINIGFNVNAIRAIRELNSVSAAARQFESNLTRVKAGNLNGVQEALARTASAFSGLAITTVLVAPMLKAIDAFSDFEQKMANVNSLLQTSDDNIKKLGDDILSMNTALGATSSAASAAAAEYQIVSAGFTDAAQSLDILEASIIAGTAGLSDTATAADGIITVMKGYTSSNITAQQASDILFATIEKGRTTFEKLAPTIGRVIPSANQAGVEMDELGAIIAVLTANGLETTEAITALKKIIIQLNAPTQRSKKAFEQLGYGAGEVKKIMGDEGLASAIDDIMQRLNDMGGAEAESTLRLLLGTGEALNAAYIIQEKRLTDLADAYDRTSNAAGASEAAFAKNTDTINAKMDQLKNSAEALGVAFSKSFGVDALAKSGLENLKHQLDVTTDRLNSNQSAMDAWKTIFGEIGSLNPAMAGFAGRLTTIVGLLGGSAAAIYGVGQAVKLYESYQLAATLAKQSTAMYMFKTATEAAAQVMVRFGGVLAIGGLAYLAKSIYDATNATKKMSAEQEKVIAKSEEMKQSYRNLTLSQKRAVDEIVKLSIDGEHEKVNAMIATGKVSQEVLDEATKRVEVMRNDLNEGAGAADAFVRALMALGNLRGGANAAMEERIASQNKAAENERRIRRERAAGEQEIANRIQQIQDDLNEGRIKSMEDFERRAMATRSAISKGGEFVKRTEEQTKEIEKLREKTDEKLIKDAKEAARERFNEINKTTKAEVELEKKTADQRIKELEKFYIKNVKGKKGLKDLELDMEVTIATEKRQNREREAREQEAANERKIQRTKDTADKEINETNRVTDANIQSLQKLLSIKTLTEEQKVKIAEDISRFEKKKRADEVRDFITSQRIKTSTLKEEIDLHKLKTSELEKDVNVGLASESQLREAMKERLALLKQEIEIKKQAALKKENLSDMDKQEIEKNAELELNQVRREVTEEYLQMMERVNEKKKEAAGMTEEQIKKEKELLDFYHSQGQGAIQSLDEFVSDMNERFSVDKFEGFGGDSKKDARRKEKQKRKKGLTDLGISDDPFDFTGPGSEKPQPLGMDGSSRHLELLSPMSNAAERTAQATQAMLQYLKMVASGRGKPPNSKDNNASYYQN